MNRELIVVALLAGAVVACSGSRATRCGDGRVCPASTRCDVENQRCVGALEEAACTGLGNGDACTLLGAPGRCAKGVCNPLFCGDGIRNNNEECDATDLHGATCASRGYYGQTGGGLACRPDCTFDERACQERCGDHVINGGERCDGDDLGGADCRTLGYYAAAGLRCSESCTFDVSACRGMCGDGVVDGTEACDGAPPPGKSCVDYGFDRGLLGCSSLCGPALEGCRSFGWSSLSAVKQPVSDVWASGPDDVFALDAGGHAVVHWDGARWSSMSTGVAEPAKLSALWGSAPDDLYVVGQSKGTGVVLHWDGKAWSSVGPDLTVPDGVFRPGGSYLVDVWGTGPDDVFAVGGYTAGVALHWDGKAWTTRSFATGPFPELARIWGSGPKDVYAVGGAGTVHWNGATWSEVAAQTSWTLFDVAGSGPDDVLATGFTAAPNLTPAVVHLDGDGWAPAPIGPGLSPSGMWTGERSDVFLLGAKAAPADQSSHTFRWNGRSWDKIKLTAPGKLTFGATYPGGVIAAGADGTLVRWDYTSWSADGVIADGVWSSGPNDAIAVGAGGIFHWDGTGWFAMATKSAIVGKMAAVWGTGPADAWAVGEGGTILHFDGTRWSAPVPGIPAVFLRGVWGASASDVYVVGDGGTILHFDGQTWEAAATGSAVNLAGVWGSGAADVYVVGSNAAGKGTIARFDGDGWKVVYSGPTPLRAVWGSGTNDIYVVGDAGTILHGGGTGWTKLESRSTQTISAVAGSGAADVFAAAEGALLHLREGAWEEIALPSANHLRGLSITPARAFVVGTLPENHLDRNVSCVGSEGICDDGWDNDCDGRADCDDPDCAAAPACKKR